VILSLDPVVERIAVVSAADMAGLALSIDRPQAGRRIAQVSNRAIGRSLGTVRLAAVQYGASYSQGRFRLELSRAEVRAAGNLPLIAAAHGYGIAGADLPHGKSAVDLTLRLVVDPPIHGRIINTQGKPLAGIRVHVLEVVTTSQERLDTFLISWKHKLASSAESVGKFRLG
jgi:hypothetical protein